MYDLQLGVDFNKILCEGDEDEVSRYLKESGIIRKRCKLKVSDVDDSGLEYMIYKYDRKFLSEEKYDSVGLIRSVITRGDKIMCYSPPKSLPWETVVEDVGSTRMDIVAVEEFVEGIMINVFYDEELGLDGGYVYATKSSIGGRVGFFDNGKYPTKTFGELFEEACEAVGLRLSMLDRSYCYSFVMQHPDYRIVQVHERPMLYLIAVYRIDNGKRCVYDVKQSYGVDSDRLAGVNKFSYNPIKGTGVLSVPQFSIMNELTYDGLYRMVCDISNKRGVNCILQGLIVSYYNSNGVYCRVKIRDTRYQQIKELRGNNPKLEYHYLTLRMSNRIKEYLEYYPEHKGDFMRYKGKLEEFSNKLYQYYREVHILKLEMKCEVCNNSLYEGLTEDGELCLRCRGRGTYKRGIRSFGTIPFQYRSHVYALHSIYLNGGDCKDRRINFEVVKRYVNQMMPAKLMFALNYDFRLKGDDLLE